MLSQAIDFLFIPSNEICLLLVAGALLLATSWRRCGRWLLIAGAALLALAGLSPIGNVLMLPLEQRFPRHTVVLEAPTGIVVLGGTLSFAVSEARGEAALNEAAERVVAAAALAHRFPQARIVFSGGNVRSGGRGPGEGALALPLFESLGVPRDRIELEEKSLNTHQNAAFSKALAQPKPGERWLLVTSAYHMPRAVGTFRGVGFKVEPYPVDWRTTGDRGPPALFRTVAGGLGRTDTAVREWLGLAAYWLAGWSPGLFPGPD